METAKGRRSTHTSRDFMASSAMPSAPAERSLYIAERVAELIPQPSDGSHRFWSNAARDTLAAFVHFIVAKVERATLQDRLLETLASPDCFANPARRMPLAIFTRGDILRDMDRIGYQGRLRQYLDDFGALSREDVQFNPVGSWDGIPTEWRPKHAGDTVRPSLAMLADYLTSVDPAHPSTSASMIAECAKYGYGDQLRSDLARFDSLANPTRTAVLTLINRRLDSTTEQATDDPLGAIRRFFARLPLGRFGEQHGFVLTELMIAVVVLGLIGLAILKLAPGITQSSNRTTFTSEVLTDIQSARGLFKGNYPAGSLNAQINTSNVIPLNNSALDDTFGGAITVTGFGTYFTITFAGIPPTACADAASQLWDGSTQFTATAISINGTNEALPISFSTAQTGCNISGQGASSGNTLTYTAS